MPASSPTSVTQFTTLLAKIMINLCEVPEVYSWGGKRIQGEKICASLVEPIKEKCVVHVIKCNAPKNRSFLKDVYGGFKKHKHNAFYFLGRS